MHHIEFLYFRDCPSHKAALALLQRVLDEERTGANVEQVEVPGPEAVEEHKFVGSPSIRIDGVDLEGEEAEASMGYGWSCRQYAQSEPGQSRGVPAAELIRKRLRESIDNNK